MNAYQNLRQRLNNEEQKILTELVNKRSQIATLVDRGLGNQTPPQYQQNLQQLETQLMFVIIVDIHKIEIEMLQKKIY